MHFTPTLRSRVLIFGMTILGVLASAVCPVSAQEENTKELSFKSMPARAAASEYQAQGKAGMVSIGAEFAGHSVTAPDHTYSSEDYVVVEAALFGPPGARATLARDDFSLRVNGKKNVLPSEPYELVFHSLKDPEWQPPPVPEDQKSSSSKGGLTTGGGGQNDSAPPPPPKMPFPLRRAMEQHVQKAAMQEGDRPLPQAGLLFFLYRGRSESIKSLELIYSGAAGKTTLTLEP
jgi:hypothetical protein